MHAYKVEYTDTINGEANYGWCRQAIVHMPELTHYGYDGGTNYAQANKVFKRELTRKAKAAVDLTGVRGETVAHAGGDYVEFRPYRSNTIMLVTLVEGEG